MTRKTLFKLLAVPVCVLLIVLLCTAPAVADTNANVIGVTSASHEFIYFIDWMSSTSMPTDAGNYRLTKDVSIYYTWNVPEGENNLDLNGHSITFVGSYGSVISVSGPDTTLNLYDKVGTGKITGGKQSGVYVYGDSAFTMYGGNITGNRASENGGGVYVGGYGSFTLVGGTIADNIVSGNYGRGGGVCVYGGTFEMYGGDITGNVASGNYGRGGGVHVYDFGTFGMYDGNITGNTAHSGGGVYVEEDSSTFTLVGGNISGNTGGGVHVVMNSIFEMSGGNISSNTAWDGGGVSVRESSTFTMSGGSISDNTAGQHGGGVHLSYDGTIILRGGTISGNTANSLGGGISVWDGTIEMYDGIISENTASQHGGGGISVREGGSFTMSGGYITGNTVMSGSNIYSYGGGVSVRDGSSFTLVGGIISGNTASGNYSFGGGVYVEGNEMFTMYDGKISGNIAKQGGGVCVSAAMSAYISDDGMFVPYDGGKFMIVGGSISGNTAEEGGGVYVGESVISIYEGMEVLLSAGEFTVCGGTITENFGDDGTSNNVYLRPNTTFYTLPEYEIAYDTRMGVTAKPSSADESVIAITGVNTRDYSCYFFADKPTDRIENRNNILYLVSTPSTHWLVQLNLGMNMIAQDASKLNQQVKKGTAITPITLTAYPGYCFDKSDYPNENGLVYTVSADKKTLTITGTPTTNTLKTLAPASESPHSITISTNGNGTATASPTSAKYGTTVTLTATPNTGYAFSEWQVISGNIQMEDNVFTMPFGDVSIKAIFLPEYLVPVEDTTESVNAATAAEVGYRVTPINIQEINAPSITRGGRSIVLDEKVVVKVTKNGVEREVEATVNADGTVNVADADIAGADSVSVTFVGRKIGDVSGDGSPNTLDAAMILKASAEIEALDVKGDFYGDVTNDGQTTTLDAARILQHSADMTDDDYELIE